MSSPHASAPRPFLILAHPGHELRLFNWLERHRPLVFVLSDGSGGDSEARTRFTLDMLERTGASAGGIFGPMPDRAWYDALLRRDATPFADAAFAMAAAARRHAPPLIVSDAVDGYNPLHDIAEAIGAAVTRRLRAEGLAPRHLAAPATAGAIGLPADSWTLDEAAASRKRAAADAYPPLAEEVRRVLSAEPDALRTERLLLPGFDWPGSWSPGWEEFGRRRVAEGRFAEAITYAGHVLPVVRSLFAWSEAGLPNSVPSR